MLSVNIIVTDIDTLHGYALYTCPMNQSKQQKTVCLKLNEVNKVDRHFQS